MVKIASVTNKLSKVITEKWQFFKKRCTESFEKNFYHHFQVGEVIFGGEDREDQRNVSGSGFSQQPGIFQAQKGGASFPENGLNVNKLSDPIKQEFTENFTELKKKKSELFCLKPVA